MVRRLLEAAEVRRRQDAALRTQLGFTVLAGILIIGAALTARPGTADWPVVAGQILLGSTTAFGAVAAILLFVPSLLRAWYWVLMPTYAAMLGLALALTHDASIAGWSAAVMLAGLCLTFVHYLRIGDDQGGEDADRPFSPLAQLAHTIGGLLIGWMIVISAATGVAETSVNGHRPPGYLYVMVWAAISVGPLALLIPEYREAATQLCGKRRRKGRRSM